MSSPQGKPGDKSSLLTLSRSKMFLLAEAYGRHGLRVHIYWFTKRDAGFVRVCSTT